MDAADAAGDEHLDAGAVREEHGGGDGGGSRGALSDDGGDVAAGYLGGARARLGEGAEVVVVEADRGDAVDYGDGGGDGAVGAHHRLHLARHLEISGVWHTVGDDRALQRHHGAAGGEGGGHLGMDNHGVSPGGGGSQR